MCKVDVNMPLNLLLAIQCGNAYANLLQMCSKKYGLINFLASVAMVSMVHDFVQMGIYRHEVHTTTDPDSIPTSTIEQFSVLPKTKYIGGVLPKNYGNKPTRLYSREVLNLKFYIEMIATSYRCVFVRSSLVYRRI